MYLNYIRLRQIDPTGKAECHGNEFSQFCTSFHDQHAGYSIFETSLRIRISSSCIVLATNPISNQGCRNVQRNSESFSRPNLRFFSQPGSQYSFERRASTTFMSNMAPRWSRLRDTRCRSLTGLSVKVGRETCPPISRFRVLDHQMTFRPQSPVTHTFVTVSGCLRSDTWFNQSEHVS